MEGKSAWSWWTRVLLGAMGVAVVGGMIVFCLATLFIRSQVRATGASARQRHAGDTVQALLACVEDATLDLKERNRTIWALGQLGDRRALAILRNCYTGQRCDHAHALCQHELDKAIKLIDGGMNVTRPSSILARLYARTEKPKNTEYQK